MFFKAAIFDLDGTILNTIADLQSAMNRMLRDFGFPEKDLAHHTKSVGSGVRDYVKHCMPSDKILDDELVTKCVNKMRDYYNENWNINTKPYDGIKELMDFFLQNGIKINVLSNKVDAATKAMVHEWFDEFEFSYIFGERDNVPRKPDPRAALEIADALGVNPNEVIFIGDSSFDMLTAENAGMYGVGVLWGYQSEKTLLGSGAKAVACNTLEIIDLVLNYE